MAEKYEYHKQNEYPGERVAEKKRVAEKAEIAIKKSDARVAEKARTEGLKADIRVAQKGRSDELKADNRVALRGKMDDELMDSEIERSTARAQGVSRMRNSTDLIGLIIVAAILVLVLVGFGWNYSLITQQTDEINSLKLQLEATPIANNEDLSSANKQIQLYNDFMVLTADVKKEVKELEQYNSTRSNSYQLCADYVDKSNNVNLAMSRFAEKQIVYYKQIAVLADRPQCNSKVDNMIAYMEKSKAADEAYYVQNMNKCGKLSNNQIGENTDWKIDLNNALDNSTILAKAFVDAEKEVIACFA